MRRYWYSMGIISCTHQSQGDRSETESRKQSVWTEISRSTSTKYSQSTNPDHAELLILRAVSTVPPITTSF
jgi:ABC-type tungstate transport system permease subunit